MSETANTKESTAWKGWNPDITGPRNFMSRYGMIHFDGTTSWLIPNRLFGVRINEYGEAV